MMIAETIAHLRLHQQQIAQPSFKTPGELIAWLGAIQAQDYAQAKWAIGIRLPGSTDTGIEQAIQNRTIIRTWGLRGTLHIMAAADVHWVLDLVGQGMIARNKTRFHQLELGDVTFKKVNTLIVKTLQGGKQLTRKDLFAALEKQGISTQGQRGIHLLYRAALEKLICLGTLQGKQFTYTLLDEWCPQVKSLTREEGLAELAKRYFTGHGPATLHDFIWWSGLSAADARSGLEMAGSGLVRETVDGQYYWMGPLKSSKTLVRATYLLPAFDEYIVGYKDRSAALDPKHFNQAISSNGIFYPVMIINGRVAGTWKRTFKKNGMSITLQPFNGLTKADKQSLSGCAEQYGKFMGMPVSFVP